LRLLACVTGGVNQELLLQIEYLAAENGVTSGAGFLALALLGFKRNMRLVAAAIASHGVFDFVHHSLIDNPSVPVWWPGFCATVDLILGAGWRFAFGMRH